MSGLAGKRVLVVEDETLIAMVLEDVLGELGCTVIGPAFDVEAGEVLARGQAIDGAILDFQIGDRSSHSIAEILAARGVPFVVASGSDDLACLPAAGGTLSKPFRPANVRAALEQVLA